MTSRRIPIRVKLLASFGLIALFILAIVVLSVAHLDAQDGSARTLVLALGAVAVAVALGLALLLSRLILRPVAAVHDRLTMLRDACTTDLRTAMDRLAGGDLTMTVTPVTPTIDTWPNDELGDLAQALNAVRDNTVGRSWPTTRRAWRWAR